VSIYDPQFLGRPDLVDERLGVILEAAVAERADRTCMGCRAA
jgi:hypothetical protein